MRNTFVTTDAYLLQLLRDGKVDAEIAVRLGVTTTEVRIRIEALCRSAGVASRDELRAWIELVDSDGDYELLEPAALAQSNAETASPVEPRPRHARRSPIVVRTAASMAAAALSIAGLVSMNGHGTSRPIPSGSTVVETPAPAVSAAVRSPLAPDVRPEGVVASRMVAEPVTLLPGVTILVTTGTAERTTAIERVTIGVTGLETRGQVLATSRGELTSTAALPTGALLFAAICDGGACDSTPSGGDAWTTFYRSDDGGRTWMADSHRDGRWLLLGIDDGEFIARRPADGAWLPADADRFEGIRLIQWQKRISFAPEDRAKFISPAGSGPALGLPFGAAGRIEYAWWMPGESAMTWTPERRPGSTYYTGVFGGAYGETRLIVETGAPLDLRGRLATGTYAANLGDEAVVVEVDGTLAPIAGFGAGTRVIMVIPG